LGETPKHTTPAYPLSDQQNKSGWVEIEALTDEFDGKELDRKKWTLGIVGLRNGQRPVKWAALVTCG